MEDPRRRTGRRLKREPATMDYKVLRPSHIRVERMRTATIFLRLARPVAAGPGEPAGAQGMPLLFGVRA